MAFPPYWHLTGRQICIFSSKLACSSKSSRNHFPNCSHKTCYFWSSKYWLIRFAPQKRYAISWITKSIKQPAVTVLVAATPSNARITSQPDLWGSPAIFFINQGWQKKGAKHEQNMSECFCIILNLKRFLAEYEFGYLS